jgi:hypothetical protein
MEVLIPVVLVIVGLIVKRLQDRSAARNNSTNPNPKIQRLVERMKAQQRANQAAQFQGQYTQPTSGRPQPRQTFGGQAGGGQVGGGQIGRGQQGSVPGQPVGRAQSSAQLAGVLQQLLQAGQDTARTTQQGQYGVPGQQVPGQYAGPATQYTPPGQFQVPQASTWAPSYQAAQPGRATPQREQPAKGDTDNRVRELMATGNEVAAVRLLCDEQDLGIIDAQKYARALVAKPNQPPRTGAGQAPRSGGTARGVQNGPERSESASLPDRDEAEPRYVGSAAFAESVFNTDRDENVWASGWVDKPDQDDRTDIEELWRTVQNNGRPTPTEN